MQALIAKCVYRCVCQAFNNRGQIKYLRVDFDEAIDDYDNALKLIPSSEVILYNRGLIHYRLGKKFYHFLHKVLTNCLIRAHVFILALH